MSTRGFIGVVCEGREFLTYNHSDSYPTYLGQAFMRTIRDLEVPVLQEYFKSLKLVQSDKRPTAANLKLMTKMGLTKKFIASSRVGMPKLSWYDHLHDYQGKLKDMIDHKIPWWIDDDGFQYSSGCEWGYLANLDTSCLELYTGHYGSPSYPKVAYKGRYVKAVKADPSLVDAPTYVVTLLESISFDELRTTPDYALQAYCERLYRRF